VELQPMSRDLMTGRLAALFVAGLLIAGCAGLGATSEPLLDKPITSEPYRLDTGDRVRVTVFGQADVSGEFRVDDGGKLPIPLLNPVPARGLTTEEFALRLEETLRQRLLRNPQVSVEISEYRPFFILGEVNRPGQYPYVNGMTVKTAAAIAGGFTFRASEREVLITRRTGDAMRDSVAALEDPVMPGDTVLVGERLF
jgi:polysaccharide export outer membrane protein